ncbi:MAG: hypothetical protein JO072_02285 [Parafilimonas sp.]|nr:hypothetical protein [Parafilimonas sp.]
MINTLPTANLAKISQFDNAVFYCMNASSERIPVGVISNVAILPDNKLEFTVSHFPVLENSWNVFAAELHFYKKGLPFNLRVHGTAWFTSKDDLTVQFNTLHVESFGQPEERAYSLQETIAEIFSTTSLFFKKMLVTGF